MTDDTLQRLERINARIRERQANLNMLVNVAVIGMVTVAAVMLWALTW